MHAIVKESLGRNGAIFMQVAGGANKAAMSLQYGVSIARCGVIYRNFRYMLFKFIEKNNHTHPFDQKTYPHAWRKLGKENVFYGQLLLMRDLLPHLDYLQQEVNAFVSSAGAHVSIQPAPDYIKEHYCGNFRTSC